MTTGIMATFLHYILYNACSVESANTNKDAQTNGVNSPALHSDAPIELDWVQQRSTRRHKTKPVYCMVSGCIYACTANKELRGHNEAKHKSEVEKKVFFVI